MSQTPRLYIADQPVSVDSSIALDEKQSHYLIRVLRLTAGSKVKLLGQAGEWLATISHADKKHAALVVQGQLRPFQASPDIWLLFAPVKNDKIDFLAQRATELGASVLWPVKTQFTQNSRINPDRLRANMIEAAEQCSRMDVPELLDYAPLEAALESWDPARILFHADESGDASPLHTQLQELQPGQKSALLIGPEGGFSPAERALLASHAHVRAATLGPRILRAETAALVGLTHLQAWLGDGNKAPAFVVD